MRKLTKILIPVILLIAIVAACTVMFSAAAETGTPKISDGQTVVYIANESKGTGDGSSADNAMGHGANYYTDLNGSDTTKKKAAYKQNAFYLAMKANDSAIVKNGGVVVICGEFSIDSCGSMRDNFSEFEWPTIAGTKNITITSYYDGVDYRTQGARLVLDTSKYGINWCIKAPTTWEYLEIQAKFDSSRGFGGGSDDDRVAMISFWGNKTVIDEQVVVESYDVRASGTKQTYYPALCAYDRYIGWTNNATMSDHVDNMNSDLTINSGTWSRVYGAVYGNYNYGKSTGVANIVVNGGTIQQISGTGRIGDIAELGTAHTGDVNITINGGTVNEVYGSNMNGVGSSGTITVEISRDVNGIEKVEAYFATSSNSAKAPTNAIVKYDRSNVSDSVVKYFTTVDATGVAPDPGVVYVSANGTGDGSSPSKPLGNDPSYYTELDNGTGGAYQKNALYLAFQKLASTGGKIVLVGDVVVDSASSRVPTGEGQKLDPSEFTLPTVGGLVTVTSTYDGTNYGGKLILDHDKCNTANLEMKSDVTFENIEMVYKYDPDDNNGWGTNFIFEASGKKLVMGEGVVVKSLNADTNEAGNRYPIIVGGHRYDKSSSTDVTVKSGTWDMIIAGGFGCSAPYYTCTVTGNAKLVIDGGKIAKVYGTGSEIKATGTINGSATITVNGGEIDTLYFTNTIVYPGTGSVVTLGANARINNAYYAESGYLGDVDDLKNRVTFIDNNQVVVKDQPPVIPNVIYIASNGTGDGSSPDKPLGDHPNYRENLQKMYALLKSVGGYGKISKLSAEEKTFIGNLYKDNVLYRAYVEASKTKKETVIVIVGDIAVDLVSSRMPYTTGEKLGPAEFTLPSFGYPVTITSVYDGKDYRNQAKFVFDLATCNTTFLVFPSATTIENINIEHRYNDKDKNLWSTPFVISANCKKFVIGENVNVTAFDTSTNSTGFWYPGIIGGHRWENKTGNANLTIKSGTWSLVHAGSYGNSGTYGKITGNATLNIEGGKIEGVYGTSSLNYPTATVTGKLTINITGGFVEALYATPKKGASNEIVVNIAGTAERVVKAWGGHSDDKIPANATINYDRSVIRDDEVKYWANANAIGKVEDQPEPYVFTLYVADVSKGKGDGSSPENAIGHAEGYAELRKQALAIIKANGGNNTNLSAEKKAITNSVYVKNALYRALSYAGNKIVKQGGRIVVCGTLTIDASDCMRIVSLGDFWTPTGSQTITITSYDGETNFRAKGAKLVLDTSEIGLSVGIDFPVVFDNLTIEHKYNSARGKGLANGAIISGMGHKLVVGYSVSVIATDVNPKEDARVEMYPTLLGGHRWKDTKKDCYITVGSGQWAALIGGDWCTPHTGNATIGINGGKIGTVCGTINPTDGTKKNVFDGSVWIGLWGGEVDNVYVVGKPGMIWGDASIGLGGTKINGKVRATHPDYSGAEIQAWVFNYTDKQIDTKKIVGFENPVPETGSKLPYIAVVATVSLVGAAALIVSKKRKTVKN
ncbi:MAG: hypothetical protein IKU48_01120 [Clostridia bacterium]|nr:hypothetical protein [Clostridia bacterium]